MQRVPRRGRRDAPPGGLRQRRLREAAGRDRPVRARRRRHLPRARRPRARPRALRLRAALRARRPRPSRRCRCTCRRAAADRLHRLSGIWGDDGLITTAFAVREYDPGATLRLGRRRRALRARAALRPGVGREPRRPRRLRRRLRAERRRRRSWPGAPACCCSRPRWRSPESTAPFGHLTPAQAGELGPARGRAAPRRHARPGDLRRGLGARARRRAPSRARSRSPARAPPSSADLDVAGRPRDRPGVERTVLGAAAPH